MNRAEIRALARTNLNDTAATRWTDAELNDWINEGLDQWTLDTNQLPTVGNPTASADLPLTAFYNAPADAVGIIQVHYQGRLLPRMTLPFWQDWDTQTGTEPDRIIIGPYGPLKFRLWPYPTADLSASLEVYYVKRPPQLTADIDVPEMPVIYHRALAWYAIAAAYLKDADTASSDLAQAWTARYASRVQDALTQQPREPLTVPIIWN